MAGTVVVAHKYLPQPDDDLVTYLNRRRERVLHVYHSFPDAPDRRSFYVLYEDGAARVRRQTRDYAGWPEPLLYGKELFFTLVWVLRTPGRFGRYVGMDGLCATFGNILRALGKVRRTVFWAIDFVPGNRFRQAWKNRVYAAINAAACRRSDEMWDLGPRMAEARSRFAGIARDDYREHHVVQYGLWLERIRTVPYEECERETLVFMGHLLEKQGVQLVLAAVPHVVARIPGFTFKVIGDGHYRAALERLAHDAGVMPHCRFLGKIPDPADLEREVARSAAAIAPYVRALDTWTAYADPGKVKTYLACGVPVLLTDLPWNADEIERRDAGRIVTEDPREIADRIVELLDPETNRRMRRNARALAAEFDYANIFAAALEKGSDETVGA